MVELKIILVLIGSYILGSIPFGLIMGKLVKGIDIRNYGSGNIGATNVLRTLGKGPAIVVFLLDALKGALPVYVCKIMHLSPVMDPYMPLFAIMAGMFSIVGHTFPVFLSFKGGKGVATSLGVMFGIDPLVALVAFAIWGILVGITRYVSLASIVASSCVPLLMFFVPTFNKTDKAFQIFAVVAVLTIILKHKSNILRLIQGTEPKLGTRVRIENDSQ